MGGHWGDEVYVFPTTVTLGTTQLYILLTMHRYPCALLTMCRCTCGVCVVCVIFYRK
jgi:hypothetical protein